LPFIIIPTSTDLCFYFATRQHQGLDNGLILYGCTWYSNTGSCSKLPSLAYAGRVKSGNKLCHTPQEFLQDQALDNNAATFHDFGRMNNNGHPGGATCNSNSTVKQATPADWTAPTYNKPRSELSSSSTNPTTNISATTPSTEAYTNKVSIPRLMREDGLALTPCKARSLQRSLRACESCRQRKAKCTKDLPVCRACDELQVSCCYADGKILRTKR
jgi:hypothetical protein